MSDTLVIVGAGGHGSVVAEAAELMRQWESIVFFDDHKPAGTIIHNWPVMGSVVDLLKKADNYTDCLVAIGKNSMRLAISHRIQECGLNLVSVVHPTASVSPNCIVEPGCAVLAGAVVNIGSRLGLATIINNAATVNHDCILSPGVHVGPNVGLGGNVSVGTESWIGIGANVKHRINIGSQVIVGCGAAVVNHIDNNSCVVGIPAKPIKTAISTPVRREATA